VPSSLPLFLPPQIFHSFFFDNSAANISYAKCVPSQKTAQWVGWGDVVAKLVISLMGIHLLEKYFLFLLFPAICNCTIFRGGCDENHPSDHQWDTICQKKYFPLSNIST